MLDAQADSPTIKFILQLNTLRPEQNGNHFTDDQIFLNTFPLMKNFEFQRKIFLKSIPQGQIDNKFTSIDSGNGLTLNRWKLTSHYLMPDNMIMMTSSNGNIFHVTGPLCGEFTGHGEFPTQRPVMRSFDVFFDLRLNKQLSKQPWGWWFETLSWSLWRHCNVHWDNTAQCLKLMTDQSPMAT